MINENEKKLISALRSGKYKQTNSRLRYHDKFCCLGVACDISGLGEWVINEDGTYFYKINGGIYDTSLPPEIMKWLNWDSHDGAIKNTFFGDNGSLANLNDSGKSFKYIAKIIENEEVSKDENE